MSCHRQEALSGLRFSLQALPTRPSEGQKIYHGLRKGVINPDKIMKKKKDQSNEKAEQKTKTDCWSSLTPTSAHALGLIHT